MKELEIYIHLPFCVKKCNYCDFLSFSDRDELIDNYIKQLCNEIKARGNGENISSIFFGGGTPSYINKKYIEKIFYTIDSCFSINPLAEISIEVNPESASYHKLKTYRLLGFNRLSIGLQRANDEDLKILGRAHNFKDFLDTYDSAREVGFGNINVDLINSIPHDTATKWEKDLSTVCKLQPEHLSLYNLIIEKGTKFHYDFSKGKLSLPTEEECEKIDLITQKITEKYLYNHYEISNYSQENYECKHNKGYWERKDYLGFGIGAASLFNNTRTRNITSLEKYLNLDFTNSDKPIELFTECTNLSEKDKIEEFIFLGLRMCKGITREEFKKTFNKDLEEVYKKQISKYRDTEFLYYDGWTLKLTEKGLRVSNVILADFLL